MRLQGKTALITGAARGIGAAIARTFAREGASVIVTDIDQERGEAIAQEIGAAFMRLNVTDEAAWDTAEQRFPTLDVLVHNAGITGLGSPKNNHGPENAALTDWRAVHAVNTVGAFLGCRIALRAMRAAGAGPIVNISSRSGLVGVRWRRPMRRPKRPFATTPNPSLSLARRRGWRSAATQSIQA